MNNQNKLAWWQPAMLMFLRLSIWIVVPVLLAIFLGKWLNNKFDIEPWGLLLSVGFAFIISMIMIVKESVKEYKKIEKKNL